MNTNLGNMPLEVFVDYISEYTNQEWYLEFIINTAFFDTIESKENNLGANVENYGSGLFWLACEGAIGYGYLFGYQNGAFGYDALGYGCFYGLENYTTGFGDWNYRNNNL